MLIQTKPLSGAFHVSMYTTIMGKEINKPRAVPQLLTSRFLLPLAHMNHMSKVRPAPQGLCLCVLIRRGLKREPSLREACRVMGSGHKMGRLTMFSPKT
jgi:hypothetical protein